MSKTYRRHQARQARSARLRREALKTNKQRRSNERVAIKREAHQ